MSYIGVKKLSGTRDVVSRLWVLVSRLLEDKKGGLGLGLGLEVPSLGLGLLS